MCGCFRSRYQELRRITGKVERKFFRGRHIVPRGVWLIKELGQIENAWRHGTLFTSWTKPCDHPEPWCEPPLGRLSLFLDKL